ncbi:MAG: hypothetical protein HY608_11350, partial [Planctomycetes bacterium]|nr:hypothetical protein [Planctomycetota bacterium]
MTPARRDGIALILVSSLLTLLVMLAVLFVRVGAAARATTRSHLDGTRAQLLARSGLEYASARLSRAPETPVPARRANQGDDWTYRDPTSVPLERSQNPSYAAGEGYDDAPPLDGRYTAGTDVFLASHDSNRNGSREGYSGRLRGAHGTHGDTFALRVESEEGKLYVNGGYLTATDGNALDPANGTADRCDRNAGYNAMLHRVLNLLGAHADVNVPGLGDIVIDNRPVGGYRSLADLPPAITPAQRERLSAYLTCRAWVDRSVIRPQLDRELGPGAAWGSDSVGLARADHIVLRGGPPALEPTGRAPVNIHLAPQPLLESLIAGLEGGVIQQAYDVGFFPDRMLLYRTKDYVNITLAAPPVAPAVAAKIVELRAGGEDTNHNGYLDAGEDTDGDGYLDAPFLSWAQFNAFCDTLGRKGVLPMASDVGPWANFGMLRQRLAGELLKANFNPNANLNKTHPDRIRFRDVDKSDLSIHSTEFSLHPISGIMSVASLGRVRDVASGVLSESRREAVLQMFLPLRQTTQKDFVGGRAPATSYITAANNAWMAGSFRTFGAKASLGGGAGIGLSLMTYPEPYLVLPNRAAAFDGQIGLATTELPTGPDPANTRFIHRFTNTWTADKATSPGTTALSPIALTDRDDINVDSLLRTTFLTTTSAFDPTRPNTFVPDGAYIQHRRMPMYTSVGNLPPRHGVISYWVKPDIRNSIDRMDVAVQQAARGADGAATQVLCIGATSGRYGALLENALQPPGELDPWHERLPVSMDTLMGGVTPWGAPPSYTSESRHEHRWVLATAQWDVDVGPSGNDNAALWLRGKWSEVMDGFSYFYDSGYLMILQGLPPTDLPNASRRLVIGGTRMYDSYVTAGSNQTIDELAVYDYGADDAVARAAAQTLSHNRYDDGRYYKRNDGRFTSTDLLLQLPAGTGFPLRVSRMFWTQILPRMPLNNPAAAGAAPPVWDDALRDSRLGIEILQGAGAGTVLLNTEEDLDADGVLDSGEDLNMNGILDFLDYTAAS